MNFPADIVLMPTPDPELARQADALRALADDLVDAAGDGRGRIGQIVAIADCMASHALEGITPAAAAGSPLAEAHVDARLAIMDGGVDEMRPATALTAIHGALFRAGMMTPGGPDASDKIGVWRRRGVSVGDHDAPAAMAVPDLIDRVFQGLRADDPIAIAALHHRLCWIHPFADGNGRTIRLHTALLMRQAGLAPDLWSLSVGLAGDRDGYHVSLARADRRPQSMEDGLGLLSDSGIALFCQHIFETTGLEMERMASLYRRHDFRRAIEHEAGDAVVMTLDH